MANNKKRFRSLKKMPSIAETEGGNFGNYSEENGGGTPVGGKYGGRSGRVGWDKRKASGETDGDRDSQPRTDDGKFTYNSVNGKETKYDGRGKTVNPLLTDGKNGIMIDDVKDQFAARSGDYYEQFKGRFYVKSSKKAHVEGKGRFTIRIAGADLIDLAKYSFDGKTGKFKGKKSAGVVSEEHAWDQVARGRRTVFDKFAIKAAKKDGKDKYSINYKGEITRYKGPDIEKAVDRLAKSLTKKADVAAFSAEDRKKIDFIKKYAVSQGVDLSGKDDAAILKFYETGLKGNGDDGDDE